MHAHNSRGRMKALLKALYIISIAVLALVSGLTPAQAKRELTPPVALPGLTAEELNQFEEGRKLFETPFRPRAGLGPMFNARKCQACHRIPSVGGHGPGYRSNIRYQGRPNSSEGKLFHARSIAGGPADVIPETALLSKRRPPSLLGLGLVEAIPKEAILAHADPDDHDGNGIRGRAAMRDGHLLRFGSQAHVGSLLEFVADALHQEMGLTSPLLEFDQEAGGLVMPRIIQTRIPRPNVSLETVQALVDFVSLLAPLQRETEVIDAAQVAHGERLFAELACSTCHVPSYQTSATPFSRAGESRRVSSAALLNQQVSPYSDFLLHDLGPALDDGLALGVAKPSEYKTPPLWGVRYRQNLLLHDGRANNLEQAIFYHGGEAARSRSRYLGLPVEDRRAVIQFLKTL